MSVSRSSRLWAVVPAAGQGRRFGGELPKQYALLAGVPVLQRTLDVLVQSGVFAGIVAAIAVGDERFARLSFAAGANVESASGGSSRASSVLAGLRHLEGRAKEDDWVLVHDAARPLLDLRSLNRLVNAIRNEVAGGILAVPVHDTVKQAESSFNDAHDACVQIKKTLPRNQLWLAQTPQMFRYGLLKNALDRAIDEGARHQDADEPAVRHYVAITDEASAMEREGHVVKIVQGRKRNIKITTPGDLALAEQILASESNP